MKGMGAVVPLALRGAFVGALGVVVVQGLTACKDTSKISAEKAGQHVEMLAKTVEGDLAEIRKGLPEGAKHLAKLYEGEEPPEKDLEKVRRALGAARRKVQDLRTAKSTFFALVDPKGTVVRNDQEQDLMVGKDVFGPFPDIKKALEADYAEGRGVMKEAKALEGRDDGQWVAASPVKVDGSVRGLYFTGWSWSAYAYRLENAVRTAARPDSEDKQAKMPLIYALVVVDKAVYGAPVTPSVNLKAVADLNPLAKTKGDAVFTTQLEITGRGFGLAVKRVSEAGKDVAVAVLRSET